MAFYRENIAIRCGEHVLSILGYDEDSKEDHNDITSDCHFDLNYAETDQDQLAVLSEEELS